jgi:glucose-6-phosphate isomerase
MKLEFYNCPQPKELDKAQMPEAPAFLSYEPNFDQIQKTVEQFSGFKNILIVGHGGSVSSFYGMYYALREQSQKQAYFLSTVDPDYIAELKTFLTPEETLVIAISKSGETITQMEALFQFADFPLLFITGSMGPLAEVAEKLNAKIVLHPPIGGRYTGMTEVALVPAALCGFDIKAMYSAASKWYDKYLQTNDAFAAASVMQQLEDKGIVDVYMPVYDSHLFPMTNLVVQLCHESFGKDGEGQTYFAHSAPESQHHTNQRFFGGRKNIAGWFASTDKPLKDFVTAISDSVATVPLKESTLGMLNGMPLSFALKAELEGTLEDAKLQNIPVISQSIGERTPEEVGNLIAFWQLYAVYGSVLRNVDPFDQPQVENSKKISFAKRLQHKGLL